MAEYIRCPECAFTIGKYVNYIEVAREAMTKEHVFEKKEYAGIDPDNLYFKNDAVPPLEPIFDALEIKNRCCRMHLLTRVSFQRIYK